MRRTWFRAAPALFALGLIVALLLISRRQQQRVLFLDLASEWEGAEAYWLPDYRLDFGDSSFASLLDSRWGRSDPRRGVLQSQGPAAGIRIPAVPFDAALALEIEPLWKPGAVGHGVRLSLNGKPLAEFEAVGPTHREATIPAGLFVLGVNLLELDCPGAESFSLRSFRIAPRTSQGFDSRGSFVERVEASSRIWQKPGAHLAYCLQVPASAALAFGLPRATQPGAGRRQVAIETEGAPTGILFEEGPGAVEDQRVSLERFGGRAACLSFRVASEGRSAGAAAWTNPRVLAPRSPAEMRVRGLRAARLPAPNIVLYVVDTLRADHLGLYGSPRDTSPVMDRLGRESIVFDRAHSHSVWTKPAVGSLLTGLLPDSHQAKDDVAPLAPGVKQISSYLKARGYTSLGFQVNGNVGRLYGFDTDYAFFIGSPDIWEGRDKASRPIGSAYVNDHVRRHLTELREPFFLMIQTGDPHSPYEPKGESRLFVKGNPLDGTTWEQSISPWTSARLRGDEAEFHKWKDYVSGLYDGEIRHNDMQFGRLLEMLRERGVYDRTAVFVTADHGEALMDHTTMSTHEEFYEETVRVPLILRPPGGTRSLRVATPVQHVDVLPTILDLAGIPKPSELPGSSLLEIAEGRGPAGPRALRLARYRDQAIQRFTADGRAVIRWPWKLVQLDVWEPRYELYDLKSDPGERKNLWQAGTPSIAFRALVGYLRPGAAAGAPAPELSPAQLEELRALGYAH